MHIHDKIDKSETDAMASNFANSLIFSQVRHVGYFSVRMRNWAYQVYRQTNNINVNFNCVDLSSASTGRPRPQCGETNIV